MHIKLGWNLHTFLLVLLLVVATKAVERYNSNSLQGITGYSSYETQQLDSNCQGYFGDHVCDDSEADCGEDYKYYSIENCNECQTYANGQIGYDNCVG